MSDNNEVQDSTVEKEVESFAEVVKEEVAKVAEQKEETPSSSSESETEEPKSIGSTCCPAVCADASICTSFQKIVSAVEELPCYDCVKKILLWTDLVQTGLLFAIINLTFFLVCICKYNLLTLFGYCAFVATTSSILFRLASITVKKYVQSVTLDNAFTDKLKTISFQVDDAVVEKHARAATKVLNAVLSVAKDVFGCKNIVLSAQFAGIFYLIATFGKCCGCPCTSYILFLIAFIAPRLYLEKKEEVDKQLSKVTAVAKDLITKAHSVLPMVGAVCPVGSSSSSSKDHPQKDNKDNKGQSSKDAKKKKI